MAYRNAKDDWSENASQERAAGRRGCSPIFWNSERKKKVGSIPPPCSESFFFFFSTPPTTHSLSSTKEVQSSLSQLFILLIFNSFYMSLPLIFTLPPRLPPFLLENSPTFFFFLPLQMNRKKKKKKTKNETENKRREGALRYKGGNLIGETKAKERERAPGARGWKSPSSSPFFFLSPSSTHARRLHTHTHTRYRHRFFLYAFFFFSFIF